MLAGFLFYVIIISKASPHQSGQARAMVNPCYGECHFDVWYFACIIQLIKHLIYLMNYTDIIFRGKMGFILNYKGPSKSFVPFLFGGSLPFGVD